MPVLVDASTGALYTFEKHHIFMKMDENYELQHWKASMIREIDSSIYGYIRELWQLYSKHHRLNLSLGDWITALTIEDYDQYRRSGLTPDKWLHTGLKLH